MKRKLDISLHEMYPALLKEFHPTLNGELKLHGLICGSKRKIWWKCDVADDHEWESSTYIRILGHDCPCCSGNKVVTSNCLATTYPKIAKEWHPTKNNGITPFDVTSKSSKKVWWKCDVSNDHEWESSVGNRASGNKCPCFDGRKAVLSNCLATINPDIAKQWHPTKNFTLTPFDVVVGSHKKVWWKCDVSKDHEWQTSVFSRLYGSNCPCCSKRKTASSNCLATMYPNDAKQWHPTKNFPLTPFNVSGSKKKFWWKCDKADDHEFEATIKDKIRVIKSYGCPLCSGKRVVLSNCLSTTHPEIANKWHPTRNIPLTPFDVTFGKNKRIWWKCKENNEHEWESTIGNLIQSVNNGGSGCPLCSNISNGEKRIKSILNEMKIYYDSQKTFDDCRYEQRLRFDFYIPKYKLLIEYDGIQHFKSINFFGGINALNEYNKKDIIKNEYAAKNNIPLLRIPYTKFNSIESEIKDFLNKNNIKIYE